MNSFIPQENDQYYRPPMRVWKCLVCGRRVQAIDNPLDKPNTTCGPHLILGETVYVEMKELCTSH